MPFHISADYVAASVVSGSACLCPAVANAEPGGI